MNGVVDTNNFCEVSGSDMTCRGSTTGGWTDQAVTELQRITIRIVEPDNDGGIDTGVISATLLFNPDDP